MVANAEAEAAVRVRGVVVEGPQRHSGRADLIRVGYPRRVRLEIEPESEAVAPGRGVVPDEVARVGDPEGRRGDVGAEKIRRPLGAQAEVVRDLVVGLDRVLDEERVAQGIVSYVVRDLQPTSATGYRQRRGGCA